MRVMAAVWSCLCCACLLACEPDDDGRMLEGGETQLEVEPDGPTAGDSSDPSGPGVEPPSGDMSAGAPGAAGTGPGMETPDPAQPSNVTGGMAPSEGGAAAGMGAVAGTGAGFAGTDAQAESDAGADDCSVLPDCDVATQCTEPDDHCIVLPSCGGVPKCLPPQDACMRECGVSGCAILESYPEQVGC